MRRDRRKVYIFLRRAADGSESMAAHLWNGREWQTRGLNAASGDSAWRVLRSDKPLWKGGPRMVLEVPA